MPHFERMIPYYKRQQVVPDGVGHLNRGFCRYGMQDYDGAMDDLDKVVEAHSWVDQTCRERNVRRGTLAVTSSVCIDSQVVVDINLQWDSRIRPLESTMEVLKLISSARTGFPRVIKQLCTTPSNST